MNASSDDREEGTNSGSAIQIRWVDMANQVRLKLEQRLLAMADMTIDETLTFVKACREVLYFETAALSFDNSADKQNESWS